MNVNFNTIERYGYAANGTVAPIDIVFDDKRIIFKYKLLIDTFLILLSMVPIVGYFIEVINNLRRLLKKVKDFFLRIDKVVNDKKGFEFLRIDYDNIIEIKIVEKTSFHSWILYHLSYLPLMDLFIFSLGSFSVVIKYIDNNKTKKKKVIFPTKIILDKFLNRVMTNSEIKNIIYKKKNKIADLYFIPFNISFAVFILYLILLALSQNKINENIFFLFILPFCVNMYLSLHENYKSFTKNSFGN